MRFGLGRKSYSVLVVPPHMSCNRLAILSARSMARWAEFSFWEAYFSRWHFVPRYLIQQRTRHRSMDTTGGYIRAGQAWTKSGLKGFGF